jgi:hypothetical protein
MGHASPEATKIFLSLGRKVHYDDGIEPTSLYSLRSAVLSENRRRLSLLKETAVSYTATDISGREKDGDHKLLYPKAEDLRAMLDKVCQMVGGSSPATLMARLCTEHAR